MNKTAAKNILKWLSGPGAEYAVYAMTATGITLTSITYLPNTLFMYKYKQFKEHARKKLPSELEQQFKKCLDMVNFSEQQKKLIEPFTVKGLDLFHSGSVSSRFGALIGIPHHFSYKNINDVDLIGLQLSLKTISDEDSNVLKLKECLVLPEDLKTFAICSEILITRNQKFLFDSSIPLIALFFSYAIGQFIKEKFNLKNKSLSTRIIMYSIVSVFGFILYCALKDGLQMYFERKSDEDIIDLDSNFIKSGVQYYESLLQRNIAIRQLLIDGIGSKMFKQNGDLNDWLLRKTPLSVRKKFFEDKLKSLYVEEED